MQPGLADGLELHGSKLERTCLFSFLFPATTEESGRQILGNGGTASSQGKQYTVEQQTTFIEIRSLVNAYIRIFPISGRSNFVILTDLNNVKKCCFLKIP